MPDTDVPNIASPLNRLTGSAQRTQIWRSPRRRKLFGLGFLALVLASLLFFKESASLTDILQEWESAALPIISPSATVTSSPPSPPIATGNATVLDSVVEKAEPVVFVLIMWSEASAREGALLIKVCSAGSYILPCDLLKDSPSSSTAAAPQSSTSSAMILRSDSWRRGWP